MRYEPAEAVKASEARGPRRFAFGGRVEVRVVPESGGLAEGRDGEGDAGPWCGLVLAGFWRLAMGVVGEGKKSGTLRCAHRRESGPFLPKRNWTAFLAQALFS